MVQLVRAYVHADKIVGQPRRVSGCTGLLGSPVVSLAAPEKNLMCRHA